MSLPSTLTQTGLLDYSYRLDGLLEEEQINDTQLNNIARPGKTKVDYTYSPAGRLTERSESGEAAYTAASTQIFYDQTSGLPNKGIMPETTLSNFYFTAEDEVAGFTSSASVGSCGYTASYAYTLRGELISAPCGGSGSSWMANGVNVHVPSVLAFGTFTWDDRIGASLSFNEFDCGGSSTLCPSSSWSYDFAGRMTGESGLVGVFKDIKSEGTTRKYDAENHLSSTTVGTGSKAVQETIAWGPNGHPNVIGTSTGGGGAKNERLHWSGDQLLFTTHSVNGNSAVDDIKIDSQGDVLPGSPSTVGYNGLTFYDRGPGGAIMGCHNYGGKVYSGFGNVWGILGLGPCSGSSVPMPTSINWSGSPYPGGSEDIGSGGTLGMLRTDGYTDGFDAIQGVRAYNSSSATWTTPDSFAGSIFDPMSQHGYLWNSNNPVDNLDPSGYDDGGDGGDPTSTPTQPDTGSPCCFTNGTPPPPPPPPPPPQDGPLPNNFDFQDINGGTIGGAAPSVAPRPNTCQLCGRGSTKPVPRTDENYLNCAVLQAAIVAGILGESEAVSGLATATIVTAPAPPLSVGLGALTFGALGGSIWFDTMMVQGAQGVCPSGP